MEWGPSDVVASIDIHFFLDHPEYGDAIEGDDSLTKLFGFSDVGLFSPFTIVDRIEAPRDALATRILLDEPARS